MNYAKINKIDVANGPGVRVSLFVSGCTHHCKECFNPETWDFAYGEPFGAAVQEELLQALAPPQIAGLTLLGGEPMEPENQKAIQPFLARVREQYPQKTIWCYTGYLFDRDLREGGRAWCSVTDGLISMLDVLVDGEFMIEKKDISLRFRGSKNQRIIDVKESLGSGRVICLE